MSIIHVRDEILAGGDALSTWMKDKLDEVHFHDRAADGRVLSERRRVASNVMGACTKPNLINDFLSPGVADSWLVAYALAYGSTVVTQEIRRSMNKKVSLFDVCDHFGIRHIDVFEFLRVEKARFVYKRTAPKPDWTTWFATVSQPIRSDGRSTHLRTRIEGCPIWLVIPWAETREES